MYVISGCVVFAIYCSSPSSLANELLQSPTFPSGFGMSVMFGSKGMLTEFDCPRSSLCICYNLVLPHLFSLFSLTLSVM